MKRTSTPLLACLPLLLWACSPAMMMTPSPEVCDDGQDNDGDGQADCADPDCVEAAACNVTPDAGSLDAGPVGTCASCGRTCTSQLDCVSVFLSQDPAVCTAGLCRFNEREVRAYLRLKTNDPRPGGGSLFTGVRLETATVRFVSTRAVDGSAVTCARLRAWSSATESRSLEKGEPGNLLNRTGVSSRRIVNSNSDILLDGVYASTGGDYLVWAEVWSGNREPDSWPGPARMGFGCAAGLAPVTLADNCPDPATAMPPCRLFDVQLERDL